MGQKTVVVTGAAGGIGSAIARRFARDGARIALLDRDVAGARAIAAAIGDGVALARACDVTSLEDCHDAMGEVIADAIVEGAAKNRRLLFVPREAWLVYQLARFAPRLYERLMLRRTATG